jgi:putative serine protease PepD
VEEVQEGSPAADAGLARGDVIVAFAGRPVAGIDQLHRSLTETEVGLRCEITVIRGAEKLALGITPQARQTAG